MMRTQPESLPGSFLVIVRLRLSSLLFLASGFLVAVVGDGRCDSQLVFALEPE